MRLSALGLTGFVVLVAGTCLSPKPAWAAIAGLQRVATVSAPIFATHAPGDTSRLFILERAGGIRVLDLNTGVLQANPFFTVPNVSTNGEGGLLGLAFHPDYFNPGTAGYRKFYVNITTDSTTFTRIREYQVDPNNPNAVNPDPTTQRQILSFSQPQTNHNGGWIGFSPNDNYLYIATGDGGSGNDSGTGHTSGTGNAQDITDNLLGKMLRIDPTNDDFPADATRNYAIPPTNPFVGATGDGEIWAYGLRNPFRASFDRITGDLWIGDVGQDNREEIDFQPANSAGGENYGWRLREGDIQTPTVGGAPPPGYVPPVYAYTHPDTTVPPVSPDGFTGRVVTGGYIYRGPDPSLQGKYFFLDSNNSATTSDDNYWIANTAPFGAVTNIDSLMVPDSGGGAATFPVSFGEDAKGNLYITYASSGDVFRIKTNQLIAGDYNADGRVDELDYDVWRQTFGNSGTGLAADGNGNGTIDAGDYVIWRSNEGASVHVGAASGASLPVPEPAAAAIIAVLLLSLLAVRCRRQLPTCYCSFRIARSNSRA